MNRCPLLTIGLLSIFIVTGASGAGTYHEVEIAPVESDEGVGLKIGVTHTLWIPSDLDTIRGIIVHQHGCGKGACEGGQTAAYDLHWQALAAKWHCALLGPSYQQSDDQDCRLWCDPRNGSGDAFVKALSLLAKESGHSELAEVPWCLWGHSGGGYWASLMQMEYPDRIVAIWFQSGSAYRRWTSGEIEAPDIPTAAMKIPMMVNAGLKERDHERFQNAWYGGLEMFRDYRARGAPIAFTPDPTSGHETRDSRYLAIPFFDSCLEQRLPRKPGTAGPLGNVDHSQSWLAPVPIDPLTEQIPPTPADKYVGDPAKAAWLPSKRIAKAWSEFIRSGAVGDSSPANPPTNVELSEQLDGIALTWQASADLESGISAFEIRRNGATIGRIPKTSASRYGRPLFQPMSYHDTPQLPVPEMRFVDPDGSASHQYTIATINGVGLSSRPTKVNVYRELLFAEIDGHRLTLDLHFPPETKTPPPLIVWIHGGGWRGGSKSRPPISFLTEHGYAIASISYRFSDKAIFPAQIHDCKAAIRWLRANAEAFGYEADWIAVAGSSAGGHLAALLGVSGGVTHLEGKVGQHLECDSSVQAVIDYYGPTDFVLRGKTQPDRAYTDKSGSFALLGGIAGQRRLDPKVEKAASPASYVTADDPPLLVLHGDEDQVVLLDQSQRLVDLYEEAGLDARLIVLEGAGHGGNQFFTGKCLEAAQEFLSRNRQAQ